VLAGPTPDHVLTRRRDRAATSSCSSLPRSWLPLLTFSQVRSVRAAHRSSARRDRATIGLADPVTCRSHPGRLPACGRSGTTRSFVSPHGARCDERGGESSTRRGPPPKKGGMGDGPRELDARGVGSDFDAESFCRDHDTSVRPARPLTNFGVRLLLDAVAICGGTVAAPRCRGEPRDSTPRQRFVLQGAAQWTRSSRPHAFVRVQRGSSTRDGGDARTTGKPFATKYAHPCSARSAETIMRRTRVTSSGSSTRRTCVSATRCGSRSRQRSDHPSFAPSTCRHSCGDTGRSSNSARDRAARQEGWCRSFAMTDGRPGTDARGVGPMQFRCGARLEIEFGAPVELSPTSYSVAGRPMCSTRAAIDRGVTVRRSYGARSAGSRARTGSRESRARASSRSSGSVAEGSTRRKMIRSVMVSPAECALLRKRTCRPKGDMVTER